MVNVVTDNLFKKIHDLAPDTNRAQFHGSAHHIGLSKESALAEAGNSALSSNIFYGLAGNLFRFVHVKGILHFIRHSMLTQISQKFCA